MRAPEPLTSLPLGLPLAAKGIHARSRFRDLFRAGGLRRAGSRAARDREQCHRPSEPEIAALFDRWNASLQTGDPHQVVANTRRARSCCRPCPTSAPDAGRQGRVLPALPAEPAVRQDRPAFRRHRLRHGRGRRAVHVHVRHDGAGRARTLHVHVCWEPVRPAASGSSRAIIPRRCPRGPHRPYGRSAGVSGDAASSPSRPRAWRRGPSRCRACRAASCPWRGRLRISRGRPCSAG